MSNEVASPPIGLPDVSRLFAESWKIYRARLILLLTIGGLGAAGTLASAVIPLIAAFPLAGLIPGLYLWTSAGLISLSGALWIATWAQLAMMEASLDPEGALGIQGYYRGSWKKILPFSWVCILLFVFTASAFFLLLVPGIFLGIALAFAPFVCVAEGLGGMEALERSLAYVRGRWFAVFGRLFLIGLATALPSFVPVAGPILGALAAPFGLVGAAALYSSLRQSAPGAPFVPSWKTKLLIAASLLGLLWPTWNAARMIREWPSMAPWVQSQLKDLMEHPLDPAMGQKLISILEGRQTPEGLNAVFEIMNSSAPARLEPQP